MTDQQRWDALGCVNSSVKTPNLDKLAAAGVRFSNAICQAPLCVPSRNSLMFGQYPTQTGIRTNGCQWQHEDALPGVPLPEMFRRAGYQTAGFGKTHWNHSKSRPTPSTRGFETRSIGQPRSSECYETGAIMMGDRDSEGLAAYFAETAAFGPGEENVHGYIGCRSTVRPEQHRDGWVTQQCLDFVDGGLDATRPLFLYLSFLKPHAGYNVLPEFEDQYSLAEIDDVGVASPDVNLRNHQTQAEASSPEFLLARRSEWREAWVNLSPEAKRRTTLRYWANCSWLDACFGRVLDALKQNGQLGNALIVFCSDHGDLMGERDHRFSKYCLYDSSIRVPLILSGSALPPEFRQTVNGDPVELIDILPTLARLAGDQSGHQGFDLLGAGVGRPASFCEFHGSGFSRSEAVEAYAWRTAEWKLIRYRLDGAWEGELYHLRTDPNEWNNRYHEEGCFEVRDRLVKELHRHLGKIGRAERPQP